LGFNDLPEEGNFTWVDRGDGNFTAWAKNQPNHYLEEDCVHALGVKYNYEWNDVQCSDCHQYTCKKGNGSKSLFSEICPETLGTIDRKYDYQSGHVILYVPED